MSGVLIEEMLNSTYWTGDTITYSFPTAVPSYDTRGEVENFEAFTEPYKVIVRSLFDELQTIVNVTFQEVAEITVTVY